jgi:RNA polymerase sigma factor (sigma-70 family)
MAPVLAKRLATDRSFERLYRKHAGDVYRYALVVLRNQADAEDVTQTTFLNAFRAMQNGERPRSPQNWLIAIAHNVCRQRFRQSQRRPNEVAYEEELAETVVDEEAISAEDIRRALGHLAFSQRSALVMRELEGRSYQEIAEILGTTVSAVETLLFRARRALREQLDEGITCHEAELAISKQLDRRLSRKERGLLRAHLRECQDCAGFARSQRAQRGALKALGAIPLPGSLAGLFGGGSGATVGGGLAIKAAAVAAGAALATGVGYEGVKHHIVRSRAPAAAAPALAKRPSPVRPATKTIEREAAVLAAPVHAAATRHAVAHKPAAEKSKARGHGRHLGRGVSTGHGRSGKSKPVAILAHATHGRAHLQQATKIHTNHRSHPKKPKPPKQPKPTTPASQHSHKAAPPKAPKHQMPKPSPSHGKKVRAPAPAGSSGSHGKSGH